MSFLEDGIDVKDAGLVKNTLVSLLHGRLSFNGDAVIASSWLL